MTPQRGRSGRRFAALMILALLASVAATSPGAGEPEPQIRFRHLTTDDGLSDSTVEAVLQDRQGFMWFGTADGLNRFDGYTFRVYLPDEEDPGSISGGYVWKLFEDSAGILWIGTSEGLNRYDRETDTFFSWRHDPEDETSLSLDTVQDILEDSRGDLWIATGLGLNRMDGSGGGFVRYVHDAEDPSSIGHDDVQVLHEDSRQRLWVGTQDGLDLLDRDSGEFLHYRHDRGDEGSLSHNFVRAIQEDRYGELWVGTEDGLNRLDPDRPERVVRYRSDPELPGSLRDDQVWSVFEDSAGVLWVGTDRGGLGRFDRERETFVHFLHDRADPNSISSNVVYEIFEDASGNLWTANYAGGVNLVDRASLAFEFYTNLPNDPESLNHQSVLSLFEDSGGEIWVGTEDGLARFERPSRRFLRFPYDPAGRAGPAAPAVPALPEDRDGVFWVGTYNGGLGRFDRRSGRFERLRLVPEDGPSDVRSQVWSIEDDRLGFLWAGTSGGLYRIDRQTGAFALFRSDFFDPTTLGHDYVWDIHEDRQGRLWLATQDGLSLYDPGRDQFLTYRHDPQDPTSLSFNQLTAIHEDPRGRLWLGTHGGGLNRFEPERETFTAYREGDGLPSDVVLSVVEDRDGLLWLGTNRGLSRFESQREFFTNFDQNDGLQGRQFNRQAALALRGGELLFGGINGFNLFDPRRIEINTDPPPVVLTGFQLFNRDVRIGEGEVLRRQITDADEITLRHDQSVLSFEYAALNYRNPGRNRYAYMLEGFDPDWVQAGTQRSVTYTNLDPGRYTFRVIGSNNNGVWNEQGAAVRLRVLPPFWATWWFRLSALLVLCASILAVHRHRLSTFRGHNLALEAEIAERRRAEAERERLLAEMETKKITLERQNAELERFAYTVSHDLKSPLVTIRGFLGLLERDAEVGDREGVRRAVQQIGVASETMSRLLGDVLELSRVGRVANPSEEVALSELAREAAGLIAGQVAQQGVELEIAEDMPTVFGDRVRLLEVFQNLLGNAVRFLDDQPRPRVSVGGRVEEDRIVCFVRDNGRGIEERYHEKIFGLFERLDPAAEGSGIGLALVKRIVEVHGGRVWVESDGPGHGTTFWFSLAPRGVRQT